MTDLQVLHLAGLIMLFVFGNAVNECVLRRIVGITNSMTRRLMSMIVMVAVMPVTLNKYSLTGLALLTSFLPFCPVIIKNINTKRSDNVKKYADYKPLLREMNIKRGKVYTFFGKPAMGKTKTGIDLAQRLAYEEVSKGLFVTTDDIEAFATRIEAFEGYGFILNKNRIACMFAKTLDYAAIEEEAYLNEADFIVIDNVYQLHGEDGNELVPRLRKLAKSCHAAVICTAPLGRFFDMHASSKDMLAAASEDERAKTLIAQSDYVSFINKWSYENVTYDEANLSCDFIIAKGKRKTSVTIDNFSVPMTPAGKFDLNLDNRLNKKE